jgi:hypothetical protein
MSTEETSVFDWVTALSSCSLAKVFEQLKLELEEDVKIRNELRPAGASYIFRTTLRDDVIVVFLEGSHVRGSVKFRINGKALDVRDGEDNIILQATLTLNDERQCRFRVNDREYESWQIRKRALQKLFFETI